MAQLRRTRARRNSGWQIVDELQPADDDTVIRKLRYAALRWYDVVIPRNAVSALEPFDLEVSLRQTAFLLAGR